MKCKKEVAGSDSLHNELFDNGYIHKIKSFKSKCNLKN